MTLDPQTFILVLSLTNFLQVVVLFAQYRVNTTYHGLGWWALGGVCGALGFAVLYLRGAPGLGWIVIVANNVLYVSGLALPYIGTLSFFGQRQQRAGLGAAWLLFSLVIVYFTYWNDSVEARRLLTSGALAVFSFLIARSFLIHAVPSIRAPAYFLALVFGVNGIFFGLRALSAVQKSTIIPDMSQTIIYLVTLIGSMLWTFGFIILVNQRLNTETQEAREKAELIFNTSPDAVLITRRADGNIVIVNDGFTALTGFTREEVLGKTAEEIKIWEDPADDKKAGTILEDKDACENREAIFRRKDGSQLIGILSTKIITLQGSQHTISIIHDITERKRLEDELHIQATTDGLTGVWNRRHFLELAHIEVMRAARLRYPLALALLDIDHFKQINDSYGHAVGDQALIALVKICRKNIREIDIFARFGGDEFILLLPGTNLEQAYEIVKRVCLVLAADPVNLNDQALTLTISAGIASLIDIQDNLDALVIRADQALYQAKEAGRNRVSVGAILDESTF